MVQGDYAEEGQCEMCHEPIEDGTLEGFLDHLRVMNPDKYGDGPPRWPDGGVVINPVSYIETYLEWK